MKFFKLNAGLKKIKAFVFAFFVLSPCIAFSMDVLAGDYRTILNAHSEELHVWNLTGNSAIYIFDFPGLTLQGRTFNRATQLIEQVQTNEGYPRVLTTEELTKYIESRRRTEANLAFGHDLLVSELVQFFNLVERDKVDIYPEEIVLRDFLINQGLMKVWRGFYQAIKPGTVILSIPQEQPKKAGEPMVSELARRAIFMHELSHGEYYTNSYYATYCRRYWNETLSAAQRDAFINFFKKYNYEVSLTELVINEMQAYLMFTPDPNSFSAAKLGLEDEELESMRRMFRAGSPPTALPMR
ncbi:MAG: hypothetical protein IPH54_04550 [Rhodoferax sp.]|nr:hypothetical protein [Rhodoferax sp.]